MNNAPSYYEILGLSPALQEDANISAQTLRNAYRRALLIHHPDKASLKPAGSNPPKYTIDQISKAFNTLSNVEERSKYITELRLRNKTSTKTVGLQEFKSGVEVVDLDDLIFDEMENVWYRGCRCGQDRGFEVNEDELEKSVDDGEVCVECKGCSIWLRVIFGVEEDLEEGEHKR